MTPQTGFRRRLNGAALEFLRTDPVCALILQEAKKSHDLDVQLRGDYVDVYFSGFNVFQIKPSSKSIRLGSDKETNARPAPWAKTWMSTADLASADIPAAVQWVRDQREPKLTGRESEFESKIIAENQTADAPLVVLDRQIVQPGWKMRLDLLLYDTELERLVLAELKLLSNEEAAGDVFLQLLKYQGLMSNNPWVPATYAHVYEQKVALGVMQHDLAAVRTDRAPLLLYLLAGFDGPSTSRGKLERLRNSVEHKRTNFNTLQVHMHAWGDFRQESCRLPSLSALPLFEEWALQNLPNA